MINKQEIGENPHIDDSIWFRALVRIGGFMQDALNEFGLSIQFIAKKSNSTKSYEKSALFVQAITEDPSSGQSYEDQMRDLCAADLRGIIRSGNTKGRVWALALAVDVDKGADGLITALELGADNNGTFQPDVDTPTSKYGIQFVGGYSPGNQPLTVANYYERGTCGHHRMHVMRTDSFMGREDDCFFAILYAGTNKVKHAVGPDGWIMDGRKVIVRTINGFDCLTLE